MTDNTHFSSQQDSSEMTRAQRLKARAHAVRHTVQTDAAGANASASENVNSSAMSQSVARKLSYPGARAREMNRRIRDIVREQEDTIYSSPKVEIATLPPHSVSASGSSWEDIANEVTAATTLRPRGLATGSMRGGLVGSAQSEISSSTWLMKPLNPRAILCETCVPDADLHKVLGGEIKSCNKYGMHYLVSRKAQHYDAHFATLRERLERVLETEKLPTLSGANVEDLLFVDIETTGLSSAQPLFLIGALSVQNEPQLDLFLARDLDEEGAVLASFAQFAQGKTLVTFNGKSFDWPYIEGRSRAHRVRPATVRAHLDMLHHARRHWKHSLPNCKLQTLELYLCGRTRVDDVKGSDIPRTYHEFAARHVEDGTGAHLMSPILHHNALDILTTAELLCILGENDL